MRSSNRSLGNPIRRFFRTMRKRLLTAIILAAPATFAIAQKPVQQTTVHRNVRHKVSKTSAAHNGGMDTERATQIQTALIQKGYLTGEPTGVWDAHTVSAMQKLQSDN